MLKLQHILLSGVLALSTISMNAADKSKGLNAGYPITPVPFTATHLSGGFWGGYLERARKVTVPLSFEKCKETDRYANFEKAAHPNDTNKPSEFPFDDTDVYKTIEGASYLMQTYPDKKMKNFLDSVITIVGKAQEPDGYLYTARTMNPKYPHPWSGPERWSKVEDLSHELYNLGHMIEGAVAHYQATGETNFLNIAKKFADCVCREIGPGKDQKHVVPGHEIAEMALAKLYLATGEKKYLNEAEYFVEMRGRTQHRDAYNQTDKPIVNQSEAVGHAVRATYYYSGVADVAALTGDTAYIHAIDRIWNNIVSKKMYITGGIGSRSWGEAFGNNYELPNATAYNETCAAIGNVYLNYRMFLLHGDSKYYDVLERTLYNGLISGISLDGGKFFYPNPLESAGNYSRKPWFGCACCPSNLCRFLPSVAGYAYATHNDNLYINLFIEGTSDIKVGKNNITLKQSTEYPFEGTTTLSIAKGGGDFTLKIRIPGWARNQVTPENLYAFSDNYQPRYTVKVNGKDVSVVDLSQGYFDIARKWKKGDKVTVSFDMTPRKIIANPKVKDDEGQMAIQRGPLVYCAEWPDNKGEDIFQVMMPAKAPLTVTTTKAPGGASEISVPVQRISYDNNGDLQTSAGKLTLIPYYAWANRGEGKMMVWLPFQAGAVHVDKGEGMVLNQFFK